MLTEVNEFMLMKEIRKSGLWEAVWEMIKSNKTSAKILPLLSRAFRGKCSTLSHLGTLDIERKRHTQKKRKRKTLYKTVM